MKKKGWGKYCKMPTDEVNISDVLERLHFLLRHFGSVLQEIEHQAVDPFGKIKNTIALMEKPSIPQPPSPSERYVEEWRKYRRNQLNRLGKSSLRYLCWQKEIVEDSMFCNCLIENVDQLPGRAIKGLVATIHQNWQKDSPEKPIVQYAHKQLLAFQGRDRTIAKWKTGAGMLLADKGAAYFARDVLLATFAHPQKASAEWAIIESSAYLRYAVYNAFYQSKEKLGNQADVTNYVLDSILDWDGWKIAPEGFRRIVEELILHNNVELIANKLRDKILTHELLGHPRLPANRNNWIGIKDAAKQKFITWLSKENILFFFDVVLKGRDPHGRRDFWLRYFEKMVDSRPLLSESTAFLISGNKNLQYGRLSAGTNSAAFVLDFGAVIAVEFSNVGRVYIYTRDEFNNRIPDLWRNAPIRESGLKDTNLPDGRMIRHVNWEEKVADTLAKYGIRP